MDYIEQTKKIYNNIIIKRITKWKITFKSKCLIIPGSDLSVHNKLDFLRQTEKFLKQLIEDMLLKGKYPNLKILGICFGLEIIVSAFKGELLNNLGEVKLIMILKKYLLIKTFLI